MRRRSDDRSASKSNRCCDGESDSRSSWSRPSAANIGPTSRDRADRGDASSGPYRVLAPLGKGGMGEVYRARDAELGREVALKFLPAHFSADAERRARFAREARLLATLNHPNIGAIYGLARSGRSDRRLILELVEGPTLADRIAALGDGVHEALAVARRIAEALEAAHEKGIVHRDLKPANVVLQKAGSGPSGSDIRAKVLDFGLAKPIVLLGPEPPTVHDARSLGWTAEGRIVGTPPYMSPEQARGEHVDKRTDIWAFGCVLFEMLSGRRPFEGGTSTDTFARILEHEPDWSVLPAATSDATRKLLKRCLEKDLSRRLRDIGDARLELEDAQSQGSAKSSSSAAEQGWWPVRGRRRNLGMVAAAFIGGAAVAGVGLFQTLRPTLRNPLENAVFSRVTNFEGTERSAAISRDGRFVAFRWDREGPLDVY